MDAYTLHLLGMADDERGKQYPTHPFVFGPDEDGEGYEAWIMGPEGEAVRIGHGPTLADALAALLRDLNVGPPPRPTAEAAFYGASDDEVAAANDLRDLYRRDRLAVLALLEEGS